MNPRSGEHGYFSEIAAQTPMCTHREVFKESIGVGMPFRYRTPDQVSYLKGEADLTPKSDVFQLGLVLAELFKGRPLLIQTKIVEQRVDIPVCLQCSML